MVRITRWLIRWPSGTVTYRVAEFERLSRAVTGNCRGSGG